jgi:Domain of unknown function (DUF892)
VSFIRAVYHAEGQKVKPLLKMAKAAQNSELKEALIHHRQGAEGQVKRLQKALEAMGIPARDSTCEPTNGIIEKGEETIERFPEGTVRMRASSQSTGHGALRGGLLRHGHRLSEGLRPERCGPADARDCADASGCATSAYDRTTVSIATRRCAT